MGADTTTEQPDRRAWRTLWPHVRRERVALAVGAILGLAGSAAALAQPLAAKAVLDALADERSVLRPVLLLSGLVGLSALVTAVHLWLLDRTAERIVLRVRLGLLDRIVRLRVPELDRQAPGDLIARTTSDTTLLRGATSTGVVEAVNGTLALVGAVVLMGILDLRLLGLTLLVLAVVAFGLVVVLPRIRRATERAQEAVGGVGAALERALAAIRTVKASGAEAREIAAVSASARKAYAEGVRSARYSALVGVFTDLAVQVSFLAVLGVGGALVASGDLEVSTLIAFLLYLFYLAGPLASLAMAATQLQEGLAAATRVAAVDDLEIEADLERAAGPPAPGRSGPRPGRSASPPLVELERVTFAYTPDRPPALAEVSFAAPAAGQTAIVGPSGAGKTTLFALLQRFYEPQAGVIRLGGSDTRTIARAELRRRLGYVEQDAPVLAGTLRDNIAYAAPQAGEEDVAAVVAETMLEGLVAALPDGLDTELATHGANLSGGERQRIAIARALLRRPELLLLDEATSQLDALNEQALREAVARAARDRTVMVIAHRLSTVVSADRIVVLDRGRVRAVGTHAELVESDELYGQLAATQFIASPAAA